MNKLFHRLAIVFGLITVAAAEQHQAPILSPAVYIGTQSVWNNGSVQVIMLDDNGKAILMTLRGVSNSEMPRSLSAILHGNSLPLDSNESIIIQKGLKQILDNTDPANWKYEKIRLILGFLGNSKKYDGIDVRKLLEDQPFQEVFMGVSGCS
jgi:hypothetical protein